MWGKGTWARLLKCRREHVLTNRISLTQTFSTPSIRWKSGRNQSSIKWSNPFKFNWINSWTYQTRSTHFSTLKINHSQSRGPSNKWTSISRLRSSISKTKESQISLRLRLRAGRRKRRWNRMGMEVTSISCLNLPEIKEPIRIQTLRLLSTHRMNFRKPNDWERNSTSWNHPRCLRFYSMTKTAFEALKTTVTETTRSLCLTEWRQWTSFIIATWRKW